MCGAAAWGYVIPPIIITIIVVVITIIFAIVIIIPLLWKRDIHAPHTSASTPEVGTIMVPRGSSVHRLGKPVVVGACWCVFDWNSLTGKAMKRQ